MKLHRFYIPSKTQPLEHELWVHEPELLKQWTKVLRYRLGDQLVLFDGLTEDRQYQITAIQDSGIHLSLVTELARKVPKSDIYLFWSLLKKDKNDWVLQKATELGVSHFVPLLADRSEKTGFNIGRAEKIIIEAVEQCGRSDVPALREPMNVQTAINDYKDKVSLFVCQQSEGTEPQISNTLDEPVGVLIGPEGGWTDAEKQLFEKEDLKHINLHDFTLRAETAAIASVTKLL